MDKTPIIVPPDLTVFSDTSKKGWGTLCQGIATGGRWTSVEKAWHISVLEFEAVRLAILFFCKIQETKINSPTDKQHDNSHLFIMHGRNPEQTLMEISKEIWGYLIERKIHLKAENIYTKSEQSSS